MGWSKDHGNVAKVNADYAKEQGNVAKQEVANLAKLKTDAEGATANATTAATNANTATQNANTAKTNADNAASEAIAQANHAKNEGDRAKAEADRLVGTDVSVLDNKIGSLSSLNTTNKTSVVGSVNEVAQQLAQITINVKSFGAKGDGVTDDTEAFRAAAATGKPMLIPYTDKHYKITGRIDIKNSIHFDGLVKMYGSTGDNTHRAFNVIDNVVDRLIISNPMIDLGWDGVTATGEQDHAIRIVAVDNVTVEGGFIRNCMGDNIYIGGIGGKIARNIVVSNVRMENPYRMNIALTGCDNVLINNCDMKYNSGYLGNLDIEPNNGYECTNITFQNCKVKATNGTNLFLSRTESAPNSKIDKIRILHCEFSSNKRCITGAYEALDNIIIDDCVFDGGEELIRINAEFESVSITRSKFKNATTSYIISIGNTNNPQQGKLIMSENTFEGTEGQIRYILIQMLDELQVANNTFKKLASSSAQNLGNISVNNITNIVIGDNIFKDVGAYALGIYGKVNNLTFKGNQIRPDIFNHISYTKGGIRVGGVIEKLETFGNIYSPNLVHNWFIAAGGSIPLNSTEIKGVKQFFSDGLPSSGTYRIGDTVENTAYISGNPSRWVCTKEGTLGVLTEVTGSVTTGTADISVNNAIPLIVGQYIKIGSYTRRIIYIDYTANLVKVHTTINADLADVGITYSPATFTAINSFL